MIVVSAAVVVVVVVVAVVAVVVVSFLYIFVVCRIFSRNSLKIETIAIKSIGNKRRMFE